MPTAPAATGGASGPAATAALTIGPVFTSTIHSISLSYPDGWDTRAATQPWTTSQLPKFEDDSVDIMYDAALTDHTFLAVASQSHTGKTREAWATALAASQDGCALEPMEWSGGSAWISRPCRLFFVAESDVGWAIRLYAPDFRATEDPGYVRLFEEILATVDLDCAAAGG